MSFFANLKDVLKLNIADIEYFHTPAHIHKQSLILAGLPRRGLLTRWSSFLINLFRNLKNIAPLPNCGQESILFFAVTHNQAAALSPLIPPKQEVCFLGLFGIAEEKFPLWSAYLLALPFFPLLLLKFLRAKGLEREAFFHVFDFYWLGYGYYLTWRYILRYSCPRLVVMANDHTMWTRTLIYAAKDEGVPTAYVQHASVTSEFPPLAFDYALLEGVDAAAKYTHHTITSTKIFLIGMPRFDNYFHAINQSLTIQTIGICTNPLDLTDELHQLGYHLHQQFPHIQFVLRPHPADPRQAEWQAIALQYEWSISIAKEELAFAFLARTDAIIAGDSNILLEAALLNVYPIYYDFPQKKLDWYGFHQDGLVSYHNKPETLIEELNDLAIAKPDIRHKAIRYCATVDTKYDGYSHELAQKLLVTLANKQEPSEEVWELSPLANGAPVYKIRSA